MGYENVRGHKEVIPPLGDIPEFDGDVEALDFDEVSGEHEIPLEEISGHELRDASWAPGELQFRNVVEGFELMGFDKDLEIAGTLEKKESRKGDPKDLNQDTLIADPILGGEGFLAVADELGSSEERGASTRLEAKLPSVLRRSLLEARSLTPEKLMRDLVDFELAKHPFSDEAALAARMQKLVAGDLRMAQKAWALLHGITTINKEIQETKSTTTFTGGFLHKRADGTWWGVLGSVGDSSATKIDIDGKAIPLFREDSLLEALIESKYFKPGQLEEMRRDPNKLFDLEVTASLLMAMGADRAKAEAMIAAATRPIIKKLSFNNIKSSMTAALGGDRPYASLSIVQFETGSKLLLETDGTKDMMERKGTDQTDYELVGRSFTSDEALAAQVDKYRALANERGKNGAASNKKSDDKGVFCVQFGKIESLDDVDLEAAT